jgi:hypothetical protein
MHRGVLERGACTIATTVASAAMSCLLATASCDLDAPGLAKRSDGSSDAAMDGSSASPGVSGSAGSSTGGRSIQQGGAGTSAGGMGAIGMDAGGPESCSPACRAPQICDPPTRRCVDCVTDDARCGADGTPERCDNGAWTAGTPCASDRVCSNGVCAPFRVRGGIVALGSPPAKTAGGVRLRAQSLGHAALLCNAAQKLCVLGGIER